MDKNEIYCGDCLGVMENIPDSSIDMVFADPPFNVGKNYGTGFKDRRNDYDVWTEKWIKLCIDKLKDTGSIYVMNISRNMNMIMNIMDKYAIWRNTIIWKNNGSGSTKNTFWKFYQPIMFYTKTDSYTFNRLTETIVNPRWSPRAIKGQLGDIWDDIPFIYTGSIKHKEAILEANSNKKKHPCQMPLGIVSRAIKFSTNKNDLVLDPFIGSGTTALACKMLDRNYIGIDMLQKNCDMSEERISQYNILNFK